MDATTAQLISGLVSNLGFPVVMCGVLVWMIVKGNKQHSEESAKWVEAINNNTAAMNNLMEAVKK